MNTPPDPSFEKLNEGFHAAYDRTRAKLEAQVPVLVVLADSLFAFQGEAKRETNLTPAAVHLIKATAHAPVAIYATLEATRDGALDADGKAQVEALLARARNARSARDAAPLEEDAATKIDEVLGASMKYLEGLRAAGRFGKRGLDDFASAMGPTLLRLTELATRLQLAALHDAVERELARLSAEERSTLEVVVAGAHQARVRNLPLQYFQTRFGEEPGEEKRVTYAESATDVEAARALVGTRRLDQKIAGAFFGDPRRLQRDVLGDAAATLLETSSFSPIV